MRKKGSFMGKMTLLLALCSILAGCSGGGDGTATATPDAPGTEVFDLSADHALSAAIRRTVSGYETVLTKVAQAGSVVYTYAIPGDLLSQAAQDAQDADAKLVDHRYAFSLDRGGDMTYQVSGFAVEQEIVGEATATPEVIEDADPISLGYLGDYETSGGGTFVHRFMYNIASDASDGTMESSSLLDGAQTGWERFAYRVLSSKMYFADITLDTSAHITLDGGTPVPAEDVYRLVVGEISGSEMDIIEYRVSAQTEIPDLSGGVEIEALANGKTLLSRMTVKSNVLTVLNESGQSTQYALQ